MLVPSDTDDGFFFWVTVQIGSNKWMAALAVSRVLLSIGSKRRVALVTLDKDFFWGCSNSLEKMDGSVGNIEGGVIDGI